MSDGGGGTGHTAGYEPVRGAEDTGSFGLGSLTSFLSSQAGAVESRAKAVASAVRSATSADARTAASYSLRDRAKEIDAMFRIDPEEARARGGIAGLVHSCEVALDRYDATHAHHLSRMEAANALAEDVRTRLERSRASWTELERETSTLSDVTDSVWKLGADVDRVCALLKETEDMMLEAEVAIRLDEVYARDVETRLSKRAAEIARREEVERMERFREAIAAQAQTNQVAQRSRQEIALEEELKRDLDVIRKSARKQAKREGKSGFTPERPAHEDHFGLLAKDGRKTNDDVDDTPIGPKRGSLAAVAAELDVAGSMRGSINRDLDDFLEDNDDEEEDGGGDIVGEKSERLYTVYGLRRQADATQTATSDDKESGASSWLASTAEVVGLARKKEKDDGSVVVNLRAPLTTMGAGDDIFVDEMPGIKPKPKTKSEDAATTDKFEAPHEPGVGEQMSEQVSAAAAVAAARAEAAAAAARAQAEAAAHVAGEAAVAAKAQAEAAAAAARKNAEAAAAAVSSSVSSGWSSLLSFGQAATNHANKLAADVSNTVNNTVHSTHERWQQHLQGSGTSVADPAECSDGLGAPAPEIPPETPAAEKEAKEEEEAESPAPAGYKVSPTSDRVDRDEGFDEVVSKEGSRRFWEEKDAAASPRATDSPPKVKDSEAKAE